MLANTLCEICRRTGHQNSADSVIRSQNIRRSVAMFDPGTNNLE